VYGSLRNGVFVATEIDSTKKQARADQNKLKAAAKKMQPLLVGVGGSYGFGPQNKDEALVFASEGLRADIQYEILKALKAQNLSQTALAERLGCSSACVSQFLDDDANLTIESMAKVLLALDRVWVIDSVPCEYAYGAADANESEWSWLDLNTLRFRPWKNPMKTLKCS
jgi:transcriptional regulator with XRE-family HTH domain